MIIEPTGGMAAWKKILLFKLKYVRGIFHDICPMKMLSFLSAQNANVNWSLNATPSYIEAAGKWFRLQNILIFFLLANDLCRSADIYVKQISFNFSLRIPGVASTSASVSIRWSFNWDRNLDDGPQGCKNGEIVTQKKKKIVIHKWSRYTKWEKPKLEK